MNDVQYFIAAVISKERNQIRMNVAAQHTLTCHLDGCLGSTADEDQKDSCLKIKVKTDLSCKTHIHSYMH